jgi:hypothetical protein
MKKIILVTILFFSLVSFGQEKNYNEIFVDCEKVVSRSSCIMNIIQNQIQEEYIKYREKAVEKYDLKQIGIKYVIEKNGIIKIESINGDFQNFKPSVVEVFKKLPKVKPIIQNGETINATLTDSFYLFPNKK